MRSRRDRTPGVTHPADGGQVVAVAFGVSGLQQEVLDLTGIELLQQTLQDLAAGSFLLGQHASGADDHQVVGGQAGYRLGGPGASLVVLVVPVQPSCPRCNSDRRSSR